MSMVGNENFEGQKEKSLCKYCVAGGPGNVSCTNNPKTEGISMDMHHNFLFSARKMGSQLSDFTLTSSR